jgi:hypothetical protein
MDLAKIIEKQVEIFIASGKPEEILGKNIEKMFTDIVSNLFRSYGDIGEAISKQVKASACASEIKLPAYNQFVAQVAAEQYSKAMEQNAAAHLAELVGEIVAPVKKEEKISTLLQEVNEHWGDMVREQGDDYIKIDVSYNDDNTAIYAIFRHPEYDFDDIKVTFYKWKRDKGWHIGYINENGRNITRKPTAAAEFVASGPLGLFFKYWAMGTVFVMDEDLDGGIYVGY